MVDTKSRGYSNSGRLSESEYSLPFFSTRPSPSSYKGSRVTKGQHIEQHLAIREGVDGKLPWKYRETYRTIALMAFKEFHFFAIMNNLLRHLITCFA